MRFPQLVVTALFCSGFLLPWKTAAQQLSGTVYDFYSKRPLEAVTVQTSSGNTTATNAAGQYTINILKKDSVWFTYFTKSTQKYPVDTLRNLSNFEIALHVDAVWLPAVKVKTSNYTLDSLQNRQEYAKVFNFRKPGLKTTSSYPTARNYIPGSVPAGLDINELINMFRFRRNRQMLSMQERLVAQEEEKYIKHRYSKYLVQKLTNLKGAELDSFMTRTKPSYELMTAMNDIELGYYIQQMYKLYQDKNRADNPLWIRPTEEE